MKNVVYLLKIFLLYLGLCVGCFLMLRIVLLYTTFENDVSFLLTKQDYVHNPIWRTAFYIHVFSAIVALAAGFTQFSDRFFKEHRPLHRAFGHIYVWNILLINVPAGMVLAIYANGLLPGKIAFIILDSLWFIFTLLAIRYALKKDFTAHREYMIRSYALTLSAITLRTWHLILSNTLTLDAVHLYMIDAWLGFVPNLLVAEWIIRARKNKPQRLNP